VHRDIKPSNIIFCEADHAFRLIDLGAMADLRTGINYCPDESILDPYYCPPEQYVLPTDAPDLASKSRVMSLAISSMLWNKHKPDRFDMYSVGLIFLQLAMPHLRTKSALQVCNISVPLCWQIVFGVGGIPLQMQSFLCSMESLFSHGAPRLLLQGWCGCLELSTAKLNKRQDWQSVVEHPVSKSACMCFNLPAPAGLSLKL
jgi:serine/threonine protein kinase